MRYIIIPLAIIVFIWWSFDSARNLFHNYKTFETEEEEELKDTAIIWLLMMCAILIAALVTITVIYW